MDKYYKLNKSNIQLIVFDFDGVMTDNRVLVDEYGKEAVFVSRADGMGVAMIKEKKIPMIILSTEINKVVSQRGNKLKIDVLQNIDNKKEALSIYCKNNNINLSKVLYVGNDINDLEVMKIVGIAAVPEDAYEAVKNFANLILHTKGGFGVVREIADLLQ